MLATPNKTLGADTAGYMRTMRGLAAVPLSRLSQKWAPLQQQLRPIAATAPRPTAPPGMVAIPAAPAYDFVVNGREIEGVTLLSTHYPSYPEGVGVDFQFPWEPAPGPHHRHTLSVPRFHLDRTPVTRAAFQRYLAESHYTPADPHNFLKGWTATGDGS